MHWIRITFIHLYLAHGGACILQERVTCKESMAPQSSDLWRSSPAHTCQLCIYTDSHDFKIEQCTDHPDKGPQTSTSINPCSFNFPDSSSQMQILSLFELFLLWFFVVVNSHQHALWVQLSENFSPLAGVNFQFFWLLKLHFYVNPPQALCLTLSTLGFGFNP